ncbi:Ribosomal RNA small subunit methyltransferase H [Novipirellula aureliae]|uniref:Ribosomal RNA small subunit methyltransferase H n=1 Tax=Novipirellula aureliae TaxID=2527966 RepID=A0A5C6E266_9BACT|nr:16S rRNA (cytosine(1402)-N(4))-methyltransferase RsmH [Novipirellula aureliae]TWU43012.1 Ribosomal RNA small subunit methyltransferase H [Novipirellula aureliae]
MPSRSDGERTCHVSVMPDEVTQWLIEASPETIIDGTYGGGGHSRLLLDQLPVGRGRVIGLDRDPSVALRVESETHDPRLTVFVASYEQTPKALAQFDLAHADAMVLDLGLSSDQLADRERGFSFTQNGPLDLRFDPENGVPASRWLASHDEKQIADAIYQYGEERFSRRIARAIVARQRERNPVDTVDDLVEICRRCVPRSRNHDIHPATRTFQALRIAVNDELGILERTLAAAPGWLSPGGRIAIISFHSLEDRIVKHAFRDDDRWEILTKKPLRPSESEVANNSRSRSAKMRVAARRA